MQSVFQFGHAHLWKNWEIHSWIKIFSSKKVEKTFKILINDLFCFGFFSINFLNLKTNYFFLSIINMWFHITGSYTSEQINDSNRIDCSKYLNKNQALFRHKSHMIAELCLIYILGIQTNWENWKKINRDNLEYTENIPKSSPWHSGSDKVFRLIFIQPSMRSIWFDDPFFNFGMHIN